MSVRLISERTKSSPTNSGLTFESVKQSALMGINEAVQSLTELVINEEPKIQIAAAVALAKILATVSDIEITEQLPLLEELQKIARKK